MTDYPMIFSAPMVQALLDGRKTQTRRLLKPQPSAPHFAHFRDGSTEYTIGPRGKGKRIPYATGDRLWVRESFAYGWPVEGNQDFPDCNQAHAITYRADGNRPFGWGRWRSWRSPIFMPRWASRLTLTVTDVRDQRVQDISEVDAIDEGALTFDLPAFGPATEQGKPPLGPSPRERFGALWNTIHGPDAWDRNDWVAAYTFTVQRGNIDQVKS